MVAAAAGGAGPATRGETAAVVEKVAVMLSRPCEVLPTAGRWSYEPKLDGFRALLTVSDFGDVRLDSRRGKALDRYFPEVIAAARALPNGVVLDGELVVPAGGGVDFAALQHRLRAGVSRIAQLACRAPAALIVFDVLSREGQDLRPEPYDQRRRILEALLHENRPGLGLMPATTDPDAATAWLRDQPPGVEGVVTKKRDQRYRPGIRGWQKLKARRTAEAVVGGVLGSLEQPGGLILGCYEQGRLRVAGRTGRLPPAAWAQVARLLRPAPPGHPWPPRLPASRFGQMPGDEIDYVQVAPELVVEIEADTAFEQGRWRHATRFLRVRHDLSVTDLAADSA
jgi:ATP-dependent DNA ligase